MNKKISQSTVRAYLKNKAVNNETFRLEIEDGFYLTFKTDLSLEEKSLFIFRVVSHCFDEYERYRPEYFDPMFAATVLQFYTDMPVLTQAQSKAEKQAKVEPLMDIEGMSAFWNEIRDLIIHSEDPEKKRFRLNVFRMRDLCRKKIRWVVENEGPYPLKSVGEFSERMSHLGAILGDILDKALHTDTDALAEYAATLSQSVDAIGGENLVKNMFDLYEQTKGEHIEEEDV